jgi:aspartate-semialdehyde dehydrogenase
MNDDAVIVLDPVNMPVIEKGLAKGARDFIGGNCTVSLMIMAMAGPIARGWVEWISSMTYQAASGAGAKNMQELAAQMRALSEAAGSLATDPSANVLDLDRAIQNAMRSPQFPTQQFGAVLAPSLIPWIDKATDNGQTLEEWKGHVEANKMLALDPPIPIDGICVRVGAMRCHSQGLTIKLKKDVPLDEFEAAIREGNKWAKVIANNADDTKKHLTPAAITGTLDVAIGRIHKLRMGPQYVGAFTVGDQLLWGAAEPLRRMLAILRAR